MLHFYGVLCVFLGPDISCIAYRLHYRFTTSLLFKPYENVQRLLLFRLDSSLRIPKVSILEPFCLPVVVAASRDMPSCLLLIAKPHQCLLQPQLPNFSIRFPRRLAIIPTLESNPDIPQQVTRKQPTLVQRKLCIAWTNFVILTLHLVPLICIRQRNLAR